MLKGAGLPELAAQVNVASYWLVGFWLVRRVYRTEVKLCLRPCLPESGPGTDISHFHRLVDGLHSRNSRCNCTRSIQDPSVNVEGLIQRPELIQNSSTESIGRSR